jgi:hypothetical protein
MPNVAKTAAIIRKKSLIGSSSNLLFNHHVVIITSRIILIYIAVAGLIKFSVCIIYFWFKLNKVDWGWFVKSPCYKIMNDFYTSCNSAKKIKTMVE